MACYSIAVIKLLASGCCLLSGYLNVCCWPLKKGLKLCRKFSSLFALSYIKCTNTRATPAQSLGVLAQSLGVLTLSRDGWNCFLMLLGWCLAWWVSAALAVQLCNGMRCPSRDSWEPSGVASLQRMLEVLVWILWGCELVSHLQRAVGEGSSRSILLAYFERKAIHPGTCSSEQMSSKECLQTREKGGASAVLV